MKHTDEFLIRAYVNREMDAQTEADFELELIKRPELAMALEADLALAIGLHALKQPQAVAPEHALKQPQAVAPEHALKQPQAVAPEHALKQPQAVAQQQEQISERSKTAPSLVPVNDDFVSQLAKPATNQRPVWRFALAAGLAFLAGALSYAWLGIKPSPEVYGGAQLVYLDKQRSLSNNVSATLPKAGPLVLMVPVASESSAACLANIAIEQAGRHWQTQAKPDDFGYAVVVLPAALLVPGVATVKVQCPAGPVATHQLELVKP